VESQAISAGVVLDYDIDGNLVGIDIDNARKQSRSQRTHPHKAPHSNANHRSLVRSLD